MTAYLSKQHSCFADLDGNRDYGNCSFSSPNHHRCHQRRRHQQHHYGSVPGGGTLPRRGGQRTWHLDQTSGSSSRLAATRAKGRSCDLWPSECGCMHSWQEPHQVKPHKFIYISLTELLNLSTNLKWMFSSLACGCLMSLLLTFSWSWLSLPLFDLELTCGAPAVRLILWISAVKICSFYSYLQIFT